MSFPFRLCVKVFLLLFYEVEAAQYLILLGGS